MRRRSDIAKRNHLGREGGRSDVAGTFVKVAATQLLPKFLTGEAGVAGTFFPHQNFPPGKKKCIGFFFPQGKNCLILGTFFPGERIREGEESACEGFHLVRFFLSGVRFG